ncbi:MAG TPA: mercuric transport protein MerTP [Cyclobacteriaceae bacterium]|nr:mercuric transport protein MerTP [Cyclobacteriaceae bacterium]HRJ80920.1 mercuric transport protein MerTP [Cyclobacteriaceae bacterium]
MKGSSILGGGLIAALLSSLCCITPVLALIAGTTSFAASFSWLEPARPYLAGVTIAVLGFAWYQKLFPKKESPECTCETDPKTTSFWKTKSFLGIITFFALAMLSFPHYAHVFYPHQERQAILVDKENLKTVEFEISGMTCQGCAEHVMHEVNKLPGVIKTTASYEKANAIVEFDDTKISETEINDAINKTGYKVESSSVFLQGK